MKNLIFIISGIFLMQTCQNDPSSERIKVDEEMLLHNLKVISHDSLQGRFFGTEGNYKTQQFMANQFDSLGIEPAFPQAYIQKFQYEFKGEFRQEVYPVSNSEKKLSNVRDTIVTGGNVVAKIQGKSKGVIIITAHLDHLGLRERSIFNGADDNASGTAALLTIANYFKDRNPKHTMIFAAVDAEEIGSLGAEYLLDNYPVPLENTVLNINLDMISHNDSQELYAAGGYHYPQLKEPLENLKSHKIHLKLGHDDPNDQVLEDWTFSSDHRIFHNQKIPFIYFGVEDHKDYHKPSDTFENINQKFYVDAVKLIIEAIEKYDTYL
ncbi:MAG: M28 family peptidase [Gramella sp.]|nr:M28 family peptidase [Christiangramia sp.]